MYLTNKSDNASQILDSQIMAIHIKMLRSLGKKKMVDALKEGFGDQKDKYKENLNNLEKKFPEELKEKTEYLFSLNSGEFVFSVDGKEKLKII